ncbi:MAG: dephospho-CoA kinase [Rhodothermales bacterium]
MKRLGVTGGIGSGKTTVCRMLEEMGARVFYADEEGKQLLVDDPEARREVIAAFGADSYHDDGRLNRAFLADQVFSDDEKLERLNRIVHPRVLARFEKVAEKAEREHVPLMVKEAALIFESGGEALLDAVAVVDAPREERIARVVARDDAEPADVKARMRHQMEPAELRRRADVVIENDGDLPQLRKQVEALYEDMSVKP